MEIEGKMKFHFEWLVMTQFAEKGSEPDAYLLKNAIGAIAISRD